MRTITKSLRVAIAIAMLAIVCLGGVTAAAEDAAQAAARIAEEQYGGRVLKVDKENGTWRVKLLQSSGRVKIVHVPDPGGGGDGSDSGRSGKSQRSGRD